MALTFGSGSVSFKMDSDFTELVERVVDRTVPGVRDRLQDSVDWVFEGARSWPVRSGWSRSQLLGEVRVDADLGAIRGRVACEADYALYVLMKDGKSAYRELIAKPLLAEGVTIVEDLREILERTLG